ncbi:unnamed protein product [Lampetra planeri]
MNAHVRAARVCWHGTGLLARHGSTGTARVCWHGTRLLARHASAGTARVCWHGKRLLARHASAGTVRVSWHGTGLLARAMISLVGDPVTLEPRGQQRQSRGLSQESSSSSATFTPLLNEGLA